MTSKREGDKKWVIAPPVNTEKDVLLGKLVCGCTCKCCIETVRTLFEEKAYSAELYDALEAEKKAVAETIKIVESLEKDHKKEIFDLNNEISKRDQKIQALELTVEAESKIRLEDKYSREKLLEEQGLSKEENQTLRAAVVQMQQDLEDLIKQREADEVKIQYEQHKNQLILSKIQQYENQIHEYERNNNDLRMKLAQQFENQLAQMKSYSGSAAAGSRQQARGLRHGHGSKAGSALALSASMSGGMFQPSAASFDTNPPCFQPAASPGGYSGSVCASPKAHTIARSNKFGGVEAGTRGGTSTAGSIAGVQTRPPASSSSLSHSTSAAHRDSLQALLQATKTWKHQL